MQSPGGDQWPVVRICGWGIPSGLWASFLMPSSMWVSRICVTLASFKSSVYFPRLFLFPNYATHNSVPWVRKEGNGSLWQCAAQLGNPITRSHTFIFPFRENRGMKSSLFVLSYTTLKEEWCRELFLLPSPVCWNLYFFTPTVFWNFSAGKLYFHKGSFICGWLSNTVFSKDSWIIAERGWSQFTGYCRVHSWDQDVYVYYTTQRWARFLSDSLTYGAGSQSSHKGTFVCEWMPNYCCGEGCNEGFF